MNLQQLLQCSVHWADLAAVDERFTAIGISDAEGLIHLKAALVALANVTDFEPTLRATYKDFNDPVKCIKPLEKNLKFAKYLRNKFVGHLHPELIEKAVEWQPMLRKLGGHPHDPKVIVIVNLWLLETAINTYVDGSGEHKVFDGETDLMYPPDWNRFLGFLEVTIRGAIQYLTLLNDHWAPMLVVPEVDFELAVMAGQTEFTYLAK